MNKVVIVTGSASGIGKAAILKFAKEGYDVVINYCHNESKAKELKNIVEEKYNVNAMTIKADISSEEEVKEMIKKVVDKYSKINVLVNNAGIVFDRAFEEITVDEFRRTLDVDVLGTFIVSREVSKYMEKGSAIVNVSSTNGTKTISPECLDYNIAKIGVQSLTRDLAYQFRPNIRVNAVAPGWVDTDMNKDLPKDYIESENEKIYISRFAKPEEIANTIFYLASDEASYINGEVINIDGGYQ